MYIYKYIHLYIYKIGTPICGSGGLSGARRNPPPLGLTPCSVRLVFGALVCCSLVG